MKDKLPQIVAEIFLLEDDEVTPELSAEHVDIWDSLNHLRLITAVETEFDIKFTMKEIQSIDCVGRLDELVQQKV